MSRGHLRRTWGLGTRLVLAQSIVLIGAILTAGLIAAVVGPPLFHEHMLRAGLNPGSAQLRHVEEAQQIANLISLGIAIAIAAILAIAVSWYLTRRLQRPLHELTQAAAAVSSGDYGARVPPNRATPEFDRLADAFNSMADQLASTEDTRRRLLSDLAHELRTPVATLAAYLEGIEDGVTPWNTASQRTLSPDPPMDRAGMG
ncbi:HAMP domain-containing protein [Nocardioides sp. 31GB23]|uniref:HAMP domain-containing protein n=1 Tax=Nocardioides sp. 31GB23 TaxID=3156065 RepID=UPI0032AECBAD